MKDKERKARGLPKYCACGGRIKYQCGVGRVFSVCLKCSPVQTIHIKGGRVVCLERKAPQ